MRIDRHICESEEPSTRYHRHRKMSYLDGSTKFDGYEMVPGKVMSDIEITSCIPCGHARESHP
jgi:hypothetical protein